MTYAQYVLLFYPLIAMQLIRWILISAHVLASAAWFGSMFYSLLVLHPRARSFFGSPRKFEEFIAYLAANARWKVLAAAAFIALTGVGLLLWPVEEQKSTAFYGCLFAKIILFVMTVGLFCFTSWILWPARILVAPDEIPKFQQRFRIIAIALISMIGVSIILGVVSSHL